MNLGERIPEFWRVVEAMCTPATLAYLDRWAAVIRDRFDRDGISLLDEDVARIVCITLWHARDFAHLINNAGGPPITDCPSCFLAALVGSAICQGNRTE